MIGTNVILKFEFIEPFERKHYVKETVGTNFLVRLKLVTSYLVESRSRYNLEGKYDRLSSFAVEAITSHFFLR